MGYFEPQKRCLLDGQVYSQITDGIGRTTDGVAWHVISYVF
jgi:hypothetical protein